LQLFVRGKLGIERLEDVFKNIERAELPFRIHAQHLYEIQALLKEISGVKGEIDKLGNAFFMSDDKLRVRNSLKQKLKNSLFQLEQMAQERTERL
jgi:dsDNA-specific endonuclease/ATPase MutS2